MNLWLILVGQPGPASSRNSAGKAQRPTAVIGGRLPPNPFLKNALPEVRFGVAMSHRAAEPEGRLWVDCGGSGEAR